MGNFKVQVAAAAAVGAAKSMGRTSRQLTADFQPVRSKFEHREFRSLTLKNGMDVLLVRDDLVAQAAYSVAVGVGTSNEPEDWPGLNALLVFLGFYDPAHKDLVEKKFDGGKSGLFSFDSSNLVARFDASGLDEV
eukprot:g6011.t1